MSKDEHNLSVRVEQTFSQHGRSWRDHVLLNAHTFVYVLEGSIVMQVEGGKAVTLGPGQTYYESPDDIHTVSKNASDSRPAKFLVFFVKDKDAPASIPVK
jgi:quercetin dioxygenase-like cupin family protein